MRGGGALLLMSGLCLACSSTYVPRPGPRVAVTMRGGNTAFVREGKTYEAGFFGGGLVDAVEGNPEAEDHARAYQNLNIAGFSVVVGGGASVVAGTVLVAMGSSTHGNEQRDSSQTIGAAMVVGGVAAYVTGLILLLNAPPHLFDAVNVYNDGLPPESFRVPKAPAYGPTSASVPAAASAPATPSTTASPPVTPVPAAPASP